MPIAAYEEVLVALGLTEGATANEAALTQLVHQPAEQAVKDYIGYDPVYAERTEYYTPRDAGPAWEVHDIEHEWIDRVTPDQVWWGHRRADKICVRHLPVISVTEIREDSWARAGQTDDAFPTSSILTSGRGYWIDLDSDGFCRSGFIYRDCGWNMWGKSIKITYGAGYSANQFMTIASPLKLAVLMTAVVMFRQFILNQKIGSGADGEFIAGNVILERLDEYEVRFSDGAGKGDASGTFGFDPGTIPDSAAMLCEPYVNFCRKITL